MASVSAITRSSSATSTLGLAFFSGKQADQKARQGSQDERKNLPPRRGGLRFPCRGFLVWHVLHGSPKGAFSNATLVAPWLKRCLIDRRPLRKSDHFPQPAPTKAALTRFDVV
jgi:hypothetical protein